VHPPATASQPDAGTLGYGTYTIAGGFRKGSADADVGTGGHEPHLSVNAPSQPTAAKTVAGRCGGGERPSPVSRWPDWSGRGSLSTNPKTRAIIIDVSFPDDDRSCLRSVGAFMTNSQPSSNGMMTGSVPVIPIFPARSIPTRFLGA